MAHTQYTPQEVPMIDPNWDRYYDDDDDDDEAVEEYEQRMYDPYGADWDGFETCY